jgi:hypothetical protein
MLDQGIARAVDPDDDQLASLRFSIGEALEKICDVSPRLILKDVEVVEHDHAEVGRFTEQLDVADVEGIAGRKKLDLALWLELCESTRDRG